MLSSKHISKIETPEKTKQWVEDIRMGGISRLKALKALYNDEGIKEKMKRSILSRGGTSEMAEDILHDSIIILDRNVRGGKFKMESSIGGYLLGICKYLWMNRRRRESKMGLPENPMKQDLVAADHPYDKIISQERKDLLDQLLVKIDAQCLKILTLWKQSFSMQEIAGAVGLSSAAMAKKYRYRCMSKLMRHLQDDQVLYRTLKDFR